MLAEIMQLAADFKKIGSLITGTLIAQLIGLAAMPILTRIFSPEDFGYLGIFAALLGLVAPIAAFSLPMGIVTCKKPSHAKALSALSLIIALLFSVVVFSAVLIDAYWLGYASAKYGDKSIYLYLLPFAIVICVLFDIADNWCTRLGAFYFKARISVVQSLLVNTFKLVGGLLNASGLILILALVINPLLFNFFLRLRPEFRFASTFKLVGIKQLIALMKKNRRFIQYQTPQLLLIAASTSGSVIIIAAIFGPIAAGFFTFSRTILTMPITLVGKAVNDVFYGKIVLDIRNKDDRLFKHFLIVSGVMALIGLIPLVVIQIWGPELFMLVFGSQWCGAGEIAIVMAYLLYMVLISGPATKVFIAFNKQSYSLIVNAFTTPLRLIALAAVGVYSSSLFDSIMAFVLVSVVHHTIIFIMAYCLCRASTKANSDTSSMQPE